MTDADTLIVGYDRLRGEPRGKRSDPDAGDCVDCGRCVAVCPTGIDIRNGLQLDCVGCAACIDACDEIMDKLGRPAGLVRYDSQRGLDGESRRLWRPRLALYGVLGVVGLVVALLSFAGRAPFEASLARVPGLPYVIENGEVRNTFELRVTNKTDEPMEIVVEPLEDDRIAFTLDRMPLRIEPLESARRMVVVAQSVDSMAAVADVVIRLRLPAGESREVRARFARP